MRICWPQFTSVSSEDARRNRQNDAREKPQPQGEAACFHEATAPIRNGANGQLQTKRSRARAPLQCETASFARPSARPATHSTQLIGHGEREHAHTRAPASARAPAQDARLRVYVAHQTAMAAAAAATKTTAATRRAKCSDVRKRDGRFCTRSPISRSRSKVQRANEPTRSGCNLRVDASAGARARAPRKLREKRRRVRIFEVSSWREVGERAPQLDDDGANRRVAACTPPILRTIERRFMSSLASAVCTVAPALSIALASGAECRESIDYLQDVGGRRWRERRMASGGNFCVPIAAMLAAFCSSF